MNMIRLLMDVQTVERFLGLLIFFILCTVFYVEGGLNEESQQIPLFQWGETEMLKKLNVDVNGRLVDARVNDRFRRATNFRFKLANKVDNQNKLGLDILIVTDYSVYKHFYESTNGDDYSAVNAIYQYYTSILHELAKMYSAQRLGYMRFKVYPVGIIISKSFQDAPWMMNALGKNHSDENARSVDAFEALTQFRDWIRSNAESLPEHDHAIAVTRLDLARFGDSHAQGIAYVRTICKIGESTSVVEDVGAMATVAIAGHELAHSLGAEHDGQNSTTGCSASHNYIMVPAVSSAKDTLPNSFTFSECTIKQIKKHIFATGHKAQCLRHSPMENVGYSGLKESNAYPGQIFDINKQCQHSFGLQFRFCGPDDYYLKQMCRQIWCRNITEGRKSRCQSKPYLPALTGTSCGNKMWCVNGACVEDDKAPTQEGCKFGDRDSGFCLKLITNEPAKCKQSVFSRFCCDSCRAYKKKVYRTLRT